MDNILFSLNIVLPLFIYMALGYILRRVGVIDDAFVDKASTFIYKFAMPVMLANNLYSSDLKSDFSLRVILYAVSCTLVITLVLCFVVPRFVKERPKAGVVIQAIFRSNFLLFAVHIMKCLYPDRSLGLTLLLVAIMSFVYNFLAVCVLSYFGGEGKLDVKRALLSIVTNPLILGSAVGVVLSLTGVRLGNTMDGVLSSISALATPMALITLGGQFRFSSARTNLKYIAACCAGRLVAVPLFIIGIAALLGFHGMEMGLLIAMSASPVAVSSYIMAKGAGCDATLAGEAVIFTSALSAFTIFLFVFVLRATGLI